MERQTAPSTAHFLPKPQFLFALLIACLLIFVQQAVTQAATITVTTRIDENQANGDCSLREAITAANGSSPVAYHGCTLAGPGSDTISIAVTGTLILSSSLPSIQEDLTINGPGINDFSIDGNDTVQILQIGSNAHVTLVDITLEHGRDTATGGGAIYSTGALTLTNVYVHSNRSTNSGGGVKSVGPITILNSKFLDNLATSNGGGLAASNLVKIENSTFSNNQATAGAGLYLLNANSTIHASTIDNNQAINTGNQQGGGIYLQYGTLHLSNSTLTENYAGNGGGALKLAISATVLVTNSTIVSNSAGSGALGLEIPIGTPTIALANTILANGLISDTNCSGAILDNNGNLDSGTSCGFTASDSRNNRDPQLSPLGNYGGTTQTMPPTRTSPAIDGGIDLVCHAAPINGVDQRGLARSKGIACDIGAVEVASLADLELAKVVTPITYTQGLTTNLTYHFTVTNHGPNPTTAFVMDLQPPHLTFTRWRCAIVTAGFGPGSNQCATVTGNGSISTGLILRTAAQALFTVEATLDSTAVGLISNTASVILHTALQDTIINRPDSATANVLPVLPAAFPMADLEIVKSVTPLIYPQGKATAASYILTVTNHGPHDVAWATITDNAPAHVTFHAWNCWAGTIGITGGATNCGLLNGTGNISNSVALGRGLSLVFTISATLESSATGVITNLAHISLPPGILQDSGVNRPDSALAAVMGVIEQSGTRITINQGSDEDDGACTPAHCSLREAIRLANSQAGQQVIAFVLPPNSTILLSNGQFPLITDDLLIDGSASPNLTIDANGMSRVFAIQANAKVAIEQITIANGNSGVGGLPGGAIVNHGELSLSNCTLRNNVGSNGGGGVYNTGSLATNNCLFLLNDGGFGSGGAIQSSGPLTLIDSVLLQNHAGQSGGTIDSSAPLTISASSIISSSAGSGGAIYSTDHLFIHDSAFTGNVAQGNGETEGGGAIVSAGTTWISNSTFAHNHALQQGGGAIENSGMLTASNSTFSANRAEQRGGAISNIAGQSLLYNTTFANNGALMGGDSLSNQGSPGAVALRNTLVASPTLTSNCFGSVADGGNNLDSGVTCVFNVANGSLNNSNPLLGPLADNGGLRQTHALLKGSPAINAGNDSACAASQVNAADQRGIARPFGSHCDIGAYEYAPDIVGCDIAPPQNGEACFDQDDHNQSMTLDDGQYLTIKLPVVPSSGYAWYLVDGVNETNGNGEPIFRLLQRSEFYVQPINQERVGQMATEIYRLDPLAPGQTTLKFVYRNENGDIHDTYELHVTTNGEFVNAQAPSDQTPIDESTAPTVDPNAPTQPLASLSAASIHAPTLDASFNWCNRNGVDYCPAVRDQKTCGSCWAFTTVGVMESAMRIKDGVNADPNLSEQYLVSCNSNNFSCNGGWWAFDYFRNKKSKADSGPGTVWEPDLVYVNQVEACPVGLTHHEKLASWAYVSINPKLTPSVDAIKQAIVDQGPVAAAVCVGNAFMAYKSGVFATNETSDCAGNSKVNHAIILVGWDDADGAWILRNSWNTWWGEQGYMRIKYGTSNVGYGASYVVYDGDPNAMQTPATPINLAANASTIAGTAQISLTWTDTSNDETGFNLYRRQNGTWGAPLATLNANITTYTDNSITCNQQYEYAVKAVNANGESANYSNTASAIAQCDGLKRPENLAATPVALGVLLNWTVTNEDQDGTQIARWHEENQAWEVIGSTSGQGNTFTDPTNLAPGQSYFYVARAFKANDKSSYTEQVSAKAPVLTLNAPTEAAVQRPSNGSLRLSWKDNSSNEDGFVIQRYSPMSQTWQVIATVGADVTSYVDAGFTCADTTQSYMVAAYQGAIRSSFSNLASGLPVECNAPITYTLTITVIGSGSVTITPSGGVYTAGQQVTVTATPAACCQFGGWSGAVVSSTSPLVLTMNDNKTLTATFALTAQATEQKVYLPAVLR